MSLLSSTIRATAHPATAYTWHYIYTDDEAPYPTLGPYSNRDQSRKHARTMLGGDWVMRGGPNGLFSIIERARPTSEGER